MEGQSTAIRPGRYGRACLSCSRAKCRCMYPAEGDSCVRCLRLTKECVPAPPARTVAVRKPRKSKTAKIEEKLDGLVSLIQSQTSQPGLTTPPLLVQSSNSNLTRGSRGNSPRSHHDQEAPDFISAPHLPLPACISDRSTQEAESSLLYFRSRMLPSFPFMHIPPSTTAERFLHLYPTLWLCIQSITTRSLGDKRLLGDSIRRTVAQRIVVEQERNIDLLLTCICFLGWIHHYKKDETCQTIWLQLALTIVYDLRLNRSPTAVADTAAAHISAPAQNFNSIVSSVEGRRTVLAAYLMSSIISTLLHTVDPLRWTPYMEECLQILLRNPGWEGDKLLAAQIRFHLMVDQISLVSLETSAISVNALQPQLQEIQRNLSLELNDNNIALFFSHSTRLLIFELGPCACPTNPSHPHDFQRLLHLQSRLDASVDWLSIFLAQPSIALLELPSVIFHQLSRSLKVLSELTMPEIPGWDRGAVRLRMDLFEVLENLASKLDGIQELLVDIDEVEPEEVSVRKAAIGIRATKGILEEEMRASEASSTIGESGDGGMNSFLDNYWLSDMIWVTEP